jgi:hypothetical protein
VFIAIGYCVLRRKTTENLQLAPSPSKVKFTGSLVHSLMQRALHGYTRSIERVGVNHRRRHVFVTEELLEGTKGVEWKEAGAMGYRVS